MNNTIVVLLVFLCKLIFLFKLSSQEQNSCGIYEFRFSSENTDKSFQDELKRRFNIAFQRSNGKSYSLGCRTLQKSDKTIFNISSYGDVTDERRTNTFSVVTFNDVGQKCNGSETRRLKVTVFCDPIMAANTSVVTAVVDDPKLCTWTFSLATKAMCNPYPIVPADTKPAVADNGVQTGGGSHFSGVGAFFLVVFLFICGYFLVGFLYKRYVAGAQGYEQIPHYLFLRRLLRAIQSPLAGTQYHRPSPNDPTYRNYDDGDEFRYDQPPLMPASLPDPSPTTGQNRFSSRPPVNNAKDESDVRLLVV